MLSSVCVITGFPIVEFEVFLLRLNAIVSTFSFEILYAGNNEVKVRSFHFALLLNFRWLLASLKPQINGHT